MMGDQILSRQVHCVSFGPFRLIAIIVIAMACCMPSNGTGNEPDTKTNKATEYFPELPPFDQRSIQDDLIYFIITDRFNNGEPSNDRGGAEGDRLVHGFDPTDEKYYHGGDLKGVTDKLDYLADMGVTAIWLTPVFRNKWVMTHDQWTTASYHGYWITDFTSVDPHLGSEDDLRELIDEAHKRNMKIIFDIVINHTADTIKYRQCHDPEYQGEDKAGPGSACIFRPYPYTPFIAESEKFLKTPDWLNDPRYYHNRGEIVYEGEAFYLGDFYGLDDVFTEDPDVVQGMIDIYQYWVREFGIDGFRIDTVGHVNVSFWTEFVPAIQQHAREHGRPEFFMFGEVVNSILNKRGYITKGNLPAVLDFDFKHSVAEYVAASGPAKEFANQFLQTDDFFIDHDTSAYMLPTFLSNHDDCRFGVPMKKSDPMASEATRLKRIRLAHAIMYFSRGIPILYYGDEQGFMGEPGFHECREDMLAGQVDIYNDNDLIGTDKTTADANFDTSHPLYQYFKELGAIYRQHPALRHGDQHVRYAAEKEGIISWSRVDPTERTEYLLAFNNSQIEKKADIPVFSRNATWAHIAGGGHVSGVATATVSIIVPPLEYAVLKSNQRVPAQDTAPNVTFTNLANRGKLQCSGFVEVSLDADVPMRVKFEIKHADDDWKPLGTDTNKPYRAYIDTADYKTGELLRLRATTAAFASNSKSATIDFEISTVNGNCE